MATMTVEEYIDRLNAFQFPATHRCPDPRYVHLIMEPWFTQIAPARAFQYGVQGMNRFGVKGAFAQIINCYHRWLRFRDLDFQVEWEDTLKDLFGYGIILAIVNGERPADIRWNVVFNNSSDPSDIFETMVDRLWDREVTLHAGSYGLQLPFLLWLGDIDAGGLLVP